ncbi:MAG: 4-alpha-glucanotransferase, partial [Bacteroidaceae bacterium]|nr:4-alpha-glucanotransferase [Bacteroidaceae bacterium]
LGKYNRINLPGTKSGNWQWRLLEKEMDADLANKIKAMTKMYARYVPTEKELKAKEAKEAKAAKEAKTK